MSNSFKNKKEEEDFEFNFNRYFGALLNVVALIIIISIICFFYKNYYCDKTETNTNKNNVKADTLNVGLHINLKDSTSIIMFNTKINKQITELNKLKTDIEESDKVKKDDIKFYFSIIGFVIAIVGFFGFKSIHDSKEIAIKNAIDEARSTSKNILNTETNKIIQERLQQFENKMDEINGNYSDLKDSLNKIYELETIISDLKIRIDLLENNKDNDISPINSATTNPNNPSSVDSLIEDSEDYDKDEFNDDNEFI